MASGPDYCCIIFTDRRLAELQKNRGQYETAIAESRKAIALGPNHGLVQMLLANNLAEAGRPDQAIPLFKTAMNHDRHKRQSKRNRHRQAGDGQVSADSE